MHEPNHAGVKAAEPAANIEHSTRGAQSELLLRYEHFRLAKIDDERILADGEFDVVRRGWRPPHVVEDWRTQDQVHQRDGVEAGRVGVEHRILAPTPDGMRLEEVNQADGYRNRNPGSPVQAAPLLDGVVGGVKATDVAVATQRHAAHTEAPRIERKLRVRRSDGGEGEHDNRKSDDSGSHRAPRTGEKPPQPCTLCSFFPL
jgi:hypothetical protein